MSRPTTTIPSYKITPEISNLSIRIGEVIGRAEEAALGDDLRLRRINRIRTIQGSLAIEGNPLTEDEITTILEGKPVIAPPQEIREVRNAAAAYDAFPQWNPASEADLLTAHGMLMAGLLDAPGRYRRVSVAVGGAGEIHHIAPPADRVPRLMSSLLSWLGGTDEHPLIASSVFHYEFEFIHPFEDGNGRVGRLWQTLILTRWNALFAFIPVESLVHARQSDYYAAIRESSVHRDGTPFIKFMLEIILEATSTPQEGLQVTPQVMRLVSVLDGAMSARELLHALGLRDRKSFRQRYLLPALERGCVEMTRPDAPNARNQKYRLTRRGRRLRQVPG